MLIYFILTITLTLILFTAYFPAIPSHWRNNSELLGPYVLFHQSRNSTPKIVPLSRFLITTNTNLNLSSRFPYFSAIDKN